MQTKGIRLLSKNYTSLSAPSIGRESRAENPVEVYILGDSEEGVTVLRQGSAPRVRASKSSEFGEGKLWAS